jgi:hypothetical protein
LITLMEESSTTNNQYAKSQPTSAIEALLVAFTTYPSRGACTLHELLPFEKEARWSCLLGARHVGDLLHVVEVKRRDCSQGSSSSRCWWRYFLRRFTGDEDRATVFKVFLDSQIINVLSLMDFNMFTGIVTKEHDLVGRSAFSACLGYFSQHVCISFSFSGNNTVLAGFGFKYM